MASAARAQSTPRIRRVRKRAPSWARLPDEELLAKRLCDLDLRIRGTQLERCIHKLYAELEAKGLELRPHCWLAEEWFSPDGVPGIAIPFYLSHRRLMRLERRMSARSRAQCQLMMDPDTRPVMRSAELIGCAA
jgi:hypothetical protein